MLSLTHRQLYFSTLFFPLSSGVPQRSVACGHKGQQKTPVAKVLTKDKTIKDQ